jgi:hypothetical protein
VIPGHPQGKLRAMLQEVIDAFGWEQSFGAR